MRGWTRDSDDALLEVSLTPAEVTLVKALLTPNTSFIIWPVRGGGKTTAMITATELDKMIGHRVKVTWTVGEVVGELRGFRVGLREELLAVFDGAITCSLDLHNFRMALYPFVEETHVDG